MNKRTVGPLARKDTIVSELEDETLIYDFATHQAHCVNLLAYRIFQHCDGTRSLAALAAVVSPIVERAVSEAEVAQAVSELEAAGLLAVPPKAPARLVDRGRRRAVKQLAAAAAVPMVWSIVAPSVAEAASMTVACMGCTAVGDCCGPSGSLAMACVLMGGTLSCGGGTCTGNGDLCQ